MIGFTLCSLVGPLLAWWWGKHHGSLFVQRYTLTSLAYDGAVFAAFVLCEPVLLLGSNLLAIVAFGVAFLFELALVAVTLALAVRAWRGHELGGRLVPRALVARLPR